MLWSRTKMLLPATSVYQIPSGLCSPSSNQASHHPQHLVIHQPECTLGNSAYICCSCQSVSLCTDREREQRSLTVGRLIIHYFLRASWGRRRAIIQEPPWEFCKFFIIGDRSQKGAFVLQLFKADATLYFNAAFKRHTKDCVYHKYTVKIWNQSIQPGHRFS